MPWTFALATVLALASTPLSAAGYQIESDIVFTSSRPLPSVASIVESLDGGYLISGQSALSEIRLIKTNRALAKKWERDVPARKGAIYTPAFTINAGDGGHWLIGQVSEIDLMSEAEAAAALKKKVSRQVPMHVFVARLDPAGNVLWRKVLGQRAEFARARFVCGLAAQDGIVLVGSKPQLYESQPLHRRPHSVQHPWIVKLDAKGELMWDAVIAGNDEAVFSTSFYSARQCSGPHLGRDGAITVGLHVFWRPTYEADGVRIVTGTGVEDKGSHSFLVVRIGPHGMLEAKAVFVGESPGLLLKERAGFRVVTNPVPARISGLRQSWLDERLVVQRTVDAPPRGYSLVLHAGAPDGRGGVHVVGRRLTPSDQRGELAIGHLSPDGKVGSMRTFVSRWGGWDFRGAATDQPANGIVVVLIGGSDVRTLRLVLEE